MDVESILVGALIGAVPSLLLAYWQYRLNTQQMMLNRQLDLIRDYTKAGQTFVTQLQQAASNLQSFAAQFGQGELTAERWKTFNAACLAENNNVLATLATGTIELTTYTALASALFSETFEDFSIPTVGSISPKPSSPADTFTNTVELSRDVNATSKVIENLYKKNLQKMTRRISH